MPAKTKRYRRVTGVSYELTISDLQKLCDEYSSEDLKIVAICHDKDTNLYGIPIKTHVHFGLESKNARTLSGFERLFKGKKVSLRQDYLQNGKYSFGYFARYLTHENDESVAAAKRRYPDTEVISNFDWRKLRDEVNAKNEPKISVLDRLTRDLIRGNITLLQIEQQYPDVYARHGATLKRRYTSHEKTMRTELNREKELKSAFRYRYRESAYALRKSIDENKKLKDENEALKKELADTKEKLRTAEPELRKQLLEYRRENYDWQLENGTYKNEIEKLKAQVKRLEEDNKFLYGQL